MKNTLENDIEAGDYISLICNVESRGISVIDGYAQEGILSFGENTLGLVQVVDKDEKIVVRIPIPRKNGYHLISVEKGKYQIIMKKTIYDDNGEIL